MSEGELTVFQTQSLGPLLHVESRSTAISGMACLVVPSVDERSVTGFSCTDAVAMVLLPSLREAHRQRHDRIRPERRQRALRGRVTPLFRPRL